MPSVVRARVVEEVRLRKGTPAAKYLKLVLNVIVIDGLRFAERTVTSDAMAECSEIGAIIGRPQANVSQVPSRVTMYKQVVKAAQPPKPKPKPPPPRPPRPPAEPPRPSAVEWDQNR